MGRAYSIPEVMEAEGGFYIGRVMDPDDEFAVPQVLAAARQSVSGTTLWWGDEGNVFDFDILMFATRSEAETVLAAYRFGQDNVTAYIRGEGY